MAVGIDGRERHMVTSELFDRSLYQETEEQTETVQMAVL